MNPFFKRVLLTGLVAGTLDIVAAHTKGLIQTGHISKRMFQFIAGGALGLKDSMSGGIGAILLGVFFHYFIAFSFTLFFFLIYTKVSILSVNKYVSGLVYGLFVWLVMNMIVWPLSRLPRYPFNLQSAIIEALILMVMIGLPISLSAHSYFRKAAYLKPQ
jgi:hypothetical protein